MSQISHWKNEENTLIGKKAPVLSWSCSFEPETDSTVSLISWKRGNPPAGKLREKIGYRSVTSEIHRFLPRRTRTLSVPRHLPYAGGIFDLHKLVPCFGQPATKPRQVKMQREVETLAEDDVVPGVRVSTAENSSE